MVAVDRAFECFVGAWGFINATLTNTTTGELIPEWHSIYPSGISSYAPNGYLSFIITANDTSEPEKRPTNVTLPAQPEDPDSVWATVAKYSLGVGGSFTLLNVTDGGSGNETWNNGTGSSGPSGIERLDVTTATLPAWVGTTLDNEFEFFDDCSVHVLITDFGDAVQTVYFYRLADNSPSSY